MTYPSGPRRDSVNEIFGEILPETTADERDAETGGNDADRDRWLQENVPPHHE